MIRQCFWFIKVLKTPACRINWITDHRCSVRKGVIRNFVKFLGKQLCQILFFNKVAETLAQVFSCEFGEISKNTVFCNASRRLFLNIKCTEDFSGERSWLVPESPGLNLDWFGESGTLIFDSLFITLFKNWDNVRLFVSYEELSDSKQVFYNM